MNAKITGILILFLVLGCSTAQTGIYSNGNYGDKKIGENLFAVTFAGNGFATYEHVQKMILLRNSEIALSNACRYFIVLRNQEKWDGYAYHGLVSEGSKQHTISNTIQITDSPIPGNLNYDAYEIYHRHKKQLAEKK